ncbi:MULTISPECIES: hypothetical protein [Flavobacterium]|uniref:hypothetical protein n=1 Tax=Flavobacterium TaxID=237 RepID=UPI001FCAF7A4|nr:MULTISPECIES: hypothetical protein [Flavobacterium]UOK42180.1 hypothetical protein LZF87_12780 [Flavobacterium enshiense]
MSISKFTIIFLLILLFGCKTQNQDRYHNEDDQYKEIYLDQFKLVYVKSLIRKCYNNSPSIERILDEDKSGFTEPLLTTDDYELIDSLTTIDKNKIQKDSILSIGRVAEGAEGKHIFTLLITKIESSDLKKLAKTRYKLQKSR